MKCKPWSWLIAAVLMLLAAGCQASVAPTPGGSQIQANDGAPQAALTISASQSPQPPAWNCDDPFADATLRFRVDYWNKTDFCQHSVPLSEFRSGGPPPDGIQPIDHPSFVNQVDGDHWLGEEWPVIAFEYQGQARAYPLAMLILHEIVNDEVAGLPVAVTYCPLCNAAIVFHRQVENEILDFGTSGNLRNSDLVMYDRQTQSWWQQLTGQAVVGDYTGTQLEFLPSRTLAWGEFKRLFPQGVVLSRDSGIERFRARYGSNPYPGLDSGRSSPFGVAADSRLPPMQRVAAFVLDGSAYAYPFDELEQMLVINDEIQGQAIAVFWQAGTRSAVDSRSMQDSRAVGSSAVYRRLVQGQELVFEPTDSPGVFKDVASGSHWNMLGRAIDGPLAGQQLEQIIAAEHFWFAWSAFQGEVEIRGAEDK